MKPSLQLRLSQHLALTPQLQQSIRLLQLSTLELSKESSRRSPITLCSSETTIRRPWRCGSARRIDRCDVPLSSAATEPLNGTDAPATVESDLHDSVMDASSSLIEWRGNSDVADEDDTSPTNWVGTTPSLREHLRAQIACQASERDRALVQLLVEALDDDGQFASHAR